MKASGSVINQQIEKLVLFDKYSFDERLRAFLLFWAFLKKDEEIKLIKTMSNLYFFVIKLMSEDKEITKDQKIEIANLLINSTKFEYLDVEFEPWERNSHCYFSADVVRFLLSYEPKSNIMRDRASLNKAREFFNRTSGFGTDWSYSEKGFSNIWLKNKRLCVFHFLNKYQYNNDFNIDIRSSDSLRNIEKILKNEIYFRDFFGKYLWTFNKLRQACDPQTFKTVKSFKFPASVSPIPVVTARLSPQQRELMTRYPF
ncbi:MAG: hypothetical protein ACRDBH_04610 [Bosea sp. (in: a-proteobacteria)]